MSNSISKGVKASWEDEVVARKRSTRYWCEVRPIDKPDSPENWTRYSSTNMAYVALGLPDTPSGTRCIAFRGRLVEAGELEHEGYHWRVVLKSMPSDVQKSERPVGRPVEAEPADQLIQFRCTTKEKQQILQAAGKQPTGAFVRETVINALEKAGDQA